MSRKTTHPGRRGNNVSLAPLSTEEALAALLKVKPADVKKLEAEEAAGKKAAKKQAK